MAVSEVPAQFHGLHVRVFTGRMSDEKVPRLAVTGVHGVAVVVTSLSILASTVHYSCSQPPHRGFRHRTAHAGRACSPDAMGYWLLQAALTQLDGQKVGRQGFATEAEAAQAAKRVTAAQLLVASLSSKVGPNFHA